jgi:tetratricopeptide (TPR) repeat protein
MTASVLRFPVRRLASVEGRSAAVRALANPAEERRLRPQDLHLDDPEMLISLVSLLWERSEADPEPVRAEAEFFYLHLAEPVRPIGAMDEREYFLGEFALIAGLQCRFLSRRDEARLWFDRAEANFRLTVRIQADLSRLAYQRLALRLEERCFVEVLELSPPLVESFRRLGMAEDALKVSFLQVLALQELGREAEAAALLEQTSDTARESGYRRLYAWAQNNLFMIYANQGHVERALEYCRVAASEMTALGNKIGLAKLRWNAGGLYRTQGRISEAIETFRFALEGFREIGMRGDAAAMHLVIADLLLEQGAEAQAEWEIRAALPIIDEEKMVPEGMAAYALLRESLRRRKIDRNALRDVHGYFQE